MDACIRYSKLEGFTALPTLLFEFHGSTAGVREQAEAMETIALAHAGNAFQWATQPEDRSRLWKARHNAYYAALALSPGRQAFSTDACVPISRLADCLLETRAELDREGVIAPIVGHVGDGNFHMGYLVDPALPAERALAEDLNQKLVARALSLEGTCSGEHGVGLHKMGFLLDEAGAGTVELMRQVKHALDPKNIMNPGKIFAW
jgi:D-lactate dehydrogenase (cytochrome)